MKCKKSPSQVFPRGSVAISALIDRPVAGSRRRAAGGFFVALIWAVAVNWGVGDTWTAGRCGGTGGRLGFNLEPLVSQSLGKVIINRHANGELLGVALLVVHSEAPLEMLLEDMIIDAF